MTPGNGTTAANSADKCTGDLFLNGDPGGLDWTAGALYGCHDQLEKGDMAA